MAEDNAFDLIVIGGGPAGSTLATLVALQGHAVLLLEKERFPRYQIGESLLPITVHALCAMLGVLDEIKSAGFVRKSGATFRWGKREEPWSFRFGVAPELAKAGATYAFQVERSRFDKILLENARKRGVDVREQHTVKDLVFRDDRVSGVRFIDDVGRERLAHGRFVVDASGHGSPLYRYAGERVYSEFFRNVALFCYFADAKRRPGDSSGNIVCATFPEGWFWFIPLSATLTSVGAVIASAYANRLQLDHESVMGAFIDSCPIIRDLLAPATRITDGPYGRFRVRRDYSYVNSAFWRPGFALIGDAACFVDPIFSTGVHLGTYAGFLAARSVNTVLGSELDERRCFTEFERRYRAEYETIYSFVMGFYDMHQDEESYFWNARKILNTEERANEAFVRLVSGVSTTDADIFDVSRQASMHLQAVENGTDMHGLEKAGRVVQSGLSVMDLEACLVSRTVREQPRYPDGLIASDDFFHWTTP